MQILRTRTGCWLIPLATALATAGCALEVEEPAASHQALQQACGTCGVPVDDIASPSLRTTQRHRDAAVFTVARSSRCSATLITPRLAITAAHCVSNPASNAHITGVRFGANAGDWRPNPPLLPTEVTVPVIACFKHPSYAALISGVSGTETPFTPDFDPCYVATSSATFRVRHDLAVLVLAYNVSWGRTGVYPVEPARPDLARVPEGSLLRYAGYGGTGGTYQLRQTVRGPLEAYYDASNVFYEGAMFSGDDYFTRGDSGGSVFSGNPDLGPLALVGVISGSPQNQFQSVFFDRSVSAPLSNSSNATWLRQFLESLVDYPGRVDVPIWVGDWDLPPYGDPSRSDTAYDALRPLDADRDGLIDLHDNCPTIYNPDQSDSDLDGVGDAALCIAPGGDFITANCNDPAADEDHDGRPDLCDNCPPSRCAIPGCDTFNPDQLDRNMDFIGDVCPLPDADGDGVPDRDDSCPGIAGSRRNYNELVETTLVGMAVLPNACDPIPVPGLTAETRTSVGGGIGRTTTAAFSFLGNAAAPTVTGDPDFRSWQVTGFRFCACEGAERDSLRQQGLCREQGCRVNYSDYSTPGILNRWGPMDLTHDGAFPEYGSTHEVVARYLDQEITPREQYRLSGVWDFISDFTTARIPFTDVEIGGVRYVEAGAMLWTSSRRAVTQAERLANGDSRVVDFLPDCAELPGGCPPLTRDVNTRSNYWAGGLRHASGSSLPGAGFVPGDLIGPFPGSDFDCPECTRAFPYPFLSRRCTQETPLCVHGQAANGQYLEYPASMLGIAPEAEAQLAAPGVTWLSVSRPAEWDEHEAVRLVGLTTEGEVTAVIGFAELSQVTSGVASARRPVQRLRNLVRDVACRARGRRRGRPAFCDRAESDPAALTLRPVILPHVPGYRRDRAGRLELGRNGYLWNFEGRSSVDGVSSVWRVHLATGVSRRVALSGTIVPGDVVAAALHTSERWAVVLDRTSAALRTFVVDTSTGHSQLIHERVLTSTAWVDVDIHIRWVRSNTFVVTASSATVGEHCILLFDASLEGDHIERQRLHGAGSLTGHIAITERGLTVHTEGPASGPIGLAWDTIPPVNPPNNPDPFNDPVALPAP